LQFEFSSSARPEPDPSNDIELFFQYVSSAIASEAAAGAFVAAAEGRDSSIDIEARLSQALDTDLGNWLGQVKQSPPTGYAQLIRMVKRWRTESAHSRGILYEHLLDTVLDQRTWRTVHADVGPRPNVSVQLLLPGSYAHATKLEPLQDVDVAVVYHASARAAEDIEDLTGALTPAIPLPTPAVLLQARRNAEARSVLLSEFGALTAAEVAELAGSEARNTSALAGRWRREGRLLAVEHHGTTYYPAFQFDSDGKPRPVVQEVLEQLSSPDTTAWQQALWFTTANGWLDGQRPVDLLDEHPVAVAAAAREVLREPVG
jgi:hypothetical protein